MLAALASLEIVDGVRSALTGMPSAEWRTTVLFAVMDAHSRLCCHLQWYLDDENSEYFVHGLTEAQQKRGLPRALLSDNGSAFTVNPRAYLHFVTKLIVEGWPQKELRELLPDRIVVRHPELCAGHHPLALPP